MDGVYGRDLLSAKALIALNRRSNFLGAMQLVLHLLAIAGSGYLVWISYDSLWLIPAWIVYGVVLTFLFAPLHECIHGTAFRTPFLNKFCAAAAGFLLFLPANYFRRFHFAHHRYTNDPNLDPEMQSPKPSTVWQYVWAMTGFGSYWWPQLRTIARYSSGNVKDSFIPKSEFSKVIKEARIHAFAYVAAILGSILTQNLWIFTFWIIPVLLGMVALRLFLLAEHAGCEQTPSMLRNTRTTLTNPIIRKLAWNMPFHCEHHLFPSVPFHRLPQLHEHVKHHIQVVSPGYRKFHSDYIHSL